MTRDILQPTDGCHVGEFRALTQGARLPGYSRQKPVCSRMVAAVPGGLGPRGGLESRNHTLCAHSSGLGGDGGHGGARMSRKMGIA